MKKFILFFFISFSGFAQKTISYADLKKMADATQSEAVANFKNKGFTFLIVKKIMLVIKKTIAVFS